jgi:hypothetical protein
MLAERNPDYRSLDPNYVNNFVLKLLLEMHRKFPEGYFGYIVGDTLRSTSAGADQIITVIETDDLDKSQLQAKRVKPIADEITEGSIRIITTPTNADGSPRSPDDLTMKVVGGNMLVFSREEDQTFLDIPLKVASEIRFNNSRIQPAS